MVGTNIKSNNTVNVTRTISAPVEKVYRAWTEPEQFDQWFGCDQVTSKKLSQDFKVGGNYRIDAACQDGKMTSVHGSYMEIVPNRKLVFSWTNNSTEFPAADTVVTVEFTARGNETEVRIMHTNFALDKAVEGHTMGWQQSLEKLAQLVA